MIFNNNLYTEDGQAIYWDYNLNQTSQPGESIDHTFTFDGSEIHGAVHAEPGTSFYTEYTMTGFGNVIVFDTANHTY